jgi:hypothetical protein
LAKLSGILRSIASSSVENNEMIQSENIFNKGAEPQSRIQPIVSPVYWIKWREKSMKVALNPSPSALLESLRSIGYTLETALVDMIEKSITAIAWRIYVKYLCF